MNQGGQASLISSCINNGTNNGNNGTRHLQCILAMYHLQCIIRNGFGGAGNGRFCVGRIGCNSGSILPRLESLQRVE
jgi:hypothetical protein